MTKRSADWDDKRFEALLRGSEGGAPPPDERFLAELRERSTQAFAEQFSERPAQPGRRHRMLVLMTRVAAVAAVIAFVVWVSTQSDESGVSFGAVLENTARADSLHLEIAEGGETREAWARSPGRLRLNRPDGTYAIDNGRRLWTVDEQANRAKPGPTAHLRADGAGVDLLSLVDLPEGITREDLASARPVEQRVEAGTLCCVYHWITPRPAGMVQVEAVATAGEAFLKSLETKVIEDDVERPIWRLTVVAANEPVDDDLFIVPETLTEDGRIGKALDVQGLVLVKPAMHRRWTPLQPQTLLKPGDWVRAEVRGAHAALLRLSSQARITIGPGTLVELATPQEVRVASGEVKIASTVDLPVTLVTPDGRQTVVPDTGVFCVREERLTKLGQPPQWLQGFEGTTTNESIGSLIAKVDGRDVPLTLGYHKVTVDIRDQIARTVIEESFVNHAKNTLEGVFHFPLPQDASISGFGMWIGGELVEADVVEKQRAREIYETILRERRDPGLLEWTGGNIFKARVFPITPHSEKRIKITYTQVLARRGDQYRYSYGLQSELLKQHPLRELGIDVTISSVTPLANVWSPTHMARIEQTEHAAHLEFSAQEYTPERDFEVVVQVAGPQADVVLIPHRRGDDGYFMLLVTPPGPAPTEGRDVLPDGEPLRLLILADTSASMSADARETQADFIAALLASLAPEDRFNLATCDVGCRWVFQVLVPADAENAERARTQLAERTSLGWTDLDRAFASAMEQTTPETHVVYVGDGITTAVDADPVQFSNRLRRLYEGHAATFHAVTVSNSYEPLAIKAIASLGGGSARRISGDEGPADVALALLGEITRPTVRDLEVSFTGLRTARVYPEELPNLPAGSQQIVLGRYLPEGRDQQGEVAVRGKLGDEEVRLSSAVTLQDAEAGNSFIPRLWARMHLDALLEQGASQTIQDEIIALSEEYHIITPYTSLLVLESDADRERFKVKRRFQMCDGERFFAAGRDDANYALLQQQMRLAGDWRINLRRNVLRQLASLGRDTEAVTQGPGGRGRDHSLDLYYGPGPLLQATLDIPAHGFHYGDIPAGSSVDSLVNWSEASASWSFEFDGDGADERSFKLGAVAPLAPPMDAEYFALNEDVLSRGSWESAEDLLASSFAGEPLACLPNLRNSGRAPASAPVSARRPARGMRSEMIGHFEVSDRYFRAGQSRVSGLSELGWFGLQPSPDPVGWLDRLFPQLPGTPKAPSPPQRHPSWTAEAIELADSLARTDELSALTGGLQITQQWETTDTRWDALVARSSALQLVSPSAWLTIGGSDRGQTLVRWCDGEQCGVVSKALLLGRVRDAKPEDLRQPPLALEDYLLRSPADTYARYVATVELQGANQTLLTLSNPGDVNARVRFLIDTRRAVVLRREDLRYDKVTSTRNVAGFVEIAGAWWPGRVESRTADNPHATVATLAYERLPANAVEQRLQAERAALDGALLLREPLPSTLDAKQVIDDGRPSIEAHVRVLLHFMGTQQWGQVLSHLAAIEALAPDKPGLRWVQDAALEVSRNREALRMRLLKRAAELTEMLSDPARASEVFFLAQIVQAQGTSVCEANETLGLLDDLRPVYEAQPAHVEAMKGWQRLRVNYLNQTQQLGAALDVQRELASDYPHDASLQAEYAQALGRVGEYEDAKALLDRSLAADVPWTPDEATNLWNTYTYLLRSRGRYPELADVLARWVAREPEATTAYAQYLSALTKLDRVEETDHLVRTWLAEGEALAAVGPETPVAAVLRARVEAAVNHALGHGFELWLNDVDERWHEPLANFALRCARHRVLSLFANQTMNDWRFRDEDASREVRKETLAILMQEIMTFPANDVARFVEWILPDAPAVAKEAWLSLATALETRWSQATEPNTQQQLAQALIRILSTKASPEEHLAFLRRQLREGAEAQRPYFAAQLFDALLEQRWSVGHEQEAIELLPEMTDATKPETRLAVQVPALYRFVDATVQNRYALSLEDVKQEELTRTELRQRQRELMRQAYAGVVATLLEAERTAAAELVPWLRIERLYLQVPLGDKLAEVAAECWEYLGPQPRELDGTATAMAELDAILLNRHLMTLGNLAARRGATPALRPKLLDYVNASIKLHGDAVGWRLLKYQLLVALDQPDDLARALEAWLGRDDALVNFWRKALAYLLAERGEIRPAIELFEAVAAADELTPSDHRALANWYLVVDERDKHEEALLAVFATMPEWRMNSALYRQLSPWRQANQPVPTELDPDVLRMFRVLFAKASPPQNYLGLLREFYQATRDFRLLAGLADAVTGHTAGKVYPFLLGMSGVLEEIREEATAGELVARIDAVRAEVQAPVDLRALDLLEVLVERRAAELLNQPDPHAERALAALQRASTHEWSAGEPRLMADFLAGLGGISNEALAAEQLRQLEALHAAAEAGDIDRLHIAGQLARCHWDCGEWERTIDLLEAALQEYAQAHDDALTVQANDVLDAYVGYLERLGRDARGERVLFEQLEHPAHAEQRAWLRARLYQLYKHATAHDSEVSLGSGAALFEAVAAQLQEEMSAAGRDQRGRLIDRLVSLCRTAKGKGIAGAGETLVAFARQRLPALLTQQVDNRQTLVERVATALRDIASVREALAMLARSIREEPRWLKHTYDDGWSRHCQHLSQWRAEITSLGDLEQPLLDLVLTALRADLGSRNHRCRNIYWRHYNHFWKAKVDDFRRVAETVYAERKHSGAAVQHIADYLCHGLEHRDRAIEMLFAAYADELLDQHGQRQLVGYLHVQNRHAESIPVLEAMITCWPGQIDYRTLLMRAYHATSRQEDLLALLVRTGAYFHEEGRWTEPVLAPLAETCVNTKLYEQAVAYCEELVALRQRTQPGLVGDDVLSRYYTWLATAHAGLGHTPQAVDAACGAIVSWGPRQDRRREALQTLKQVLSRAAALDAYVVHLDRETDETRLDRPIVRKALGEVYAEKSHYDQAITQLQLALESQPNDAETHAQLIKCYEKQGDAAGAIRQTLTSLRLQPRDIELYRSLAQRYQKQELPEQTERAYTSIVELLPNESESHAALAEIRQEQDRWTDALVHWERVAEIRELEPTGLLKVGRAQIHLTQWDEARKTLTKLRAKPWPPRFSNVEAEIQMLERQVEQGPGR